MMILFFVGSVQCQRESESGITRLKLAAMYCSSIAVILSPLSLILWPQGSGYSICPVVCGISASYTLGTKHTSITVSCQYQMVLEKMTLGVQVPDWEESLVAFIAGLE
jgi:hypothetical protein